MDQLIRQAIRQKLVLHVQYSGRARLFLPHSYGCNKAGHDMVSGWQSNGGSESNEPSGWKQFLLDKIESLQPSGKTFSRPMQGYKRNSAEFRHIYVEL